MLLTRAGESWKIGQVPNTEFMAESKSQPKGTLDYYRDVRKNSGLWSCCGYDGLSLVFELPFVAVQSLTENQKRGLMGLLTRLADAGEEDLRNRVQAMEDQTWEDRLAGMVHLSARFDA